MSQAENDPKVFQVVCPLCNGILWIDAESREVIKTERVKREKGSLDDLLDKEKKRKLGFDRKFEATAELQAERRKKAKEQFSKALTGVDEEADLDLPEG